LFYNSYIKPLFYLYSLIIYSYCSAFNNFSLVNLLSISYSLSLYLLMF